MTTHRDVEKKQSQSNKTQKKSKDEQDNGFYNLAHTLPHCAYMAVAYVPKQSKCCQNGIQYVLLM